jgi:hypothetical protein
MFGIRAGVLSDARQRAAAGGSGAGRQLEVDTCRSMSGGTWLESKTSS